ncbi:PE family protein PE3 [Mycobacterium talmoniae]|uniref:PE family protein PE3 n=1 Tax=Mycobacterium talmoniae TaxID=1858794 RepID=A0A2S8BEW9_9MYCO|nr:PE family protein PE3 [Mycobacterium talmoniae]
MSVRRGGPRIGVDVGDKQDRTRKLDVGAVTGRRSRSSSVAVLAVAGSVLLAGASTLSSELPSGVRTVRSLAQLLSDEALIMGGSGMPLPTQSYMDTVYGNFIAPNVVGNYTTQALFTPEQFYPFTGVKQLPFDTSVAQGLSSLDDTIRGQLADGNNLVVFGYSQSATITSLEMEQLTQNPPTLDPGQQLSFVLIGDPNNPDGGIFERFAGLSFPSLGLTFSAPTPTDTIYPTDIYTTEYDGWADFPRYPLNILADLNAFAGSYNAHFDYTQLTPDQLAQAIELPGSADLTGVGSTNYWIIPTENLPLLDPLRSVPVVGNPLADLLQPDLRVLVNLGYGSIDNGWDPGPANVPTGFGLFPTNINPLEVLQALASGAQQGVHDFMADLSSSSSSLSLADLTEPVAALSTGALSPADLPSLTDIVNALSSAASDGYAALLPTADVLNALITTIPAYDVSLFVDGLQELIAGDPMGLVSAFGDPIAADIALLTLLESVESTVITDAVQSVVADLSTLIPF